MQFRVAVSALLAASLTVRNAALVDQKADGQISVTAGAVFVRKEKHDRSVSEQEGPAGFPAVWPRFESRLLRSAVPVAGSARHAGSDFVQDNKASGVVCPTWLNSDIQKDNLKPFVNNTGVNADGFVGELTRLCGTQEVAGEYSGSWDNQAPDQNDVRVLTGLTDWATEEKKAGRTKGFTWKSFSKPDKGHGMADMVEFLMKNPKPITASGPPRVLDLGCGGGEDIVAMQGALKTPVKDTLCLDVFPINRPEVTPFLLDTSSAAKYKESLDKALVGNENSVHVAFSMVTFHHISDPQMRSDALYFLHKVLAPGGILLLAEWDNSVQPDRWIHYDLVHLLPNMLFSGQAPTDPEELKMGTKYLSVQDWIDTAQKSGLTLDTERSKDFGHGPEEQAAMPGNADRDFNLIFTKQ